MPNTKKHTPAETKKDSTGPAKKEYRITRAEDGRMHQIVYAIFQRIVWKSELGEKEEWIRVREWKLGLKTASTVQEILLSLQAAERGEELPKLRQPGKKETEP